jgi:AcrR family transcriptional regulator
LRSGSVTVADDFKVRKLPRQLRSRATVEAIFQGALQVLEKAESPDASVQDIADRAGVSVGSVYQYFPSKESLVNGLLAFHLKDRMEEFEKHVAAVQALPPEEAARTLVSNWVQAMAPRLRIERALARAFVRVGSLASLTEYDGVMLAAMERYLRSLEGKIRPVDPAMAAFVVSNALRAAVLLAMVQRPEYLGSEAFTEELIHLVTSYLKASPPPAA